MIFTHRPRVSLTRFSLCWWRHNRLLMTSQWPDSCDAITWIMISNSLDIDFIHGDIHGRSCKNISIQHSLSQGQFHGMQWFTDWFPARHISVSCFISFEVNPMENAIVTTYDRWWQELVILRDEILQSWLLLALPHSLPCPGDPIRRGQLGTGTNMVTYWFNKSCVVASLVTYSWCKFCFQVYVSDRFL